MVLNQEIIRWRNKKNKNETRGKKVKTEKINHLMEMQKETMLTRREKRKEKDVNQNQRQGESVVRKRDRDIM